MFCVTNKLDNEGKSGVSYQNGLLFKKMCDINKNMTKMSVIIKKQYCNSKKKIRVVSAYYEKL